jgi:hypothetical protein
VPSTFLTSQFSVYRIHTLVTDITPEQIQGSTAHITHAQQQHTQCTKGRADKTYSIHHQSITFNITISQPNAHPTPRHLTTVRPFLPLNPELETEKATETPCKKDNRYVSFRANKRPEPDPQERAQRQKGMYRGQETVMYAIPSMRYTDLPE